MIFSFLPVYQTTRGKIIFLSFPYVFYPFKSFQIFPSFLFSFLPTKRSLRVCLVGRKRERKERGGGKSGGKREKWVFGMERKVEGKENWREKWREKNMWGPPYSFLPKVGGKGRERKSKKKVGSTIMVNYNFIPKKINI